jgi:uncharacterized protein (DUF2132 family)
MECRAKITDRWRLRCPQVNLRLMSSPNQPNNPLHGITLERIIVALVEELGWAEMGRRVRIACFTDGPSVRSSLTFLRKTPWARAKVESLYLEIRRRAEKDAPPESQR